jgi:hypothetical protein
VSTGINFNSIIRSCYYNNFKCNSSVPGISGGGSSADGYAAATFSSLATTIFGIPFTGSISAAGFTIGFIKG